MSNLPRELPPDFFSAFQALTAKSRLEVEDLKLMVLVECAGDGLYGSLADATPVEEAAELLRKNGREETAHAHRLKKAIEILTGSAYEIPSKEENPYSTPPAFPAVTSDLLDAFKSAEFDGDRYYQTWAEAEPNEEVATLLRQNGREETRHGERVTQAAEILAQAS